MLEIDGLSSCYAEVSFTEAINGFKEYLKLNLEAAMDALISPVTYCRELKEQKGGVKAILTGVGVLGIPVAVATAAALVEGSFTHRSVMLGITAWNVEAIVADTLLHPIPTIN